MTHLKKQLIMTLALLLTAATSAWAQTGENIFQYCYDCQRSPAYPKAMTSASLSGFTYPYVGYSANPGTQGSTSAGPWKLEYVGLWSSTDKHGIEDFRVSNYQQTYNCTDVPVFRLYQWNATANEYQPAAYGVVCCYAKVSNAADHTVLFEAEGGLGCVLTNSSHSSSMNITFDEDLTTGLTTIIAAAKPAAAGTPVPLTWDAAKPNTATLTNGMPAGNVTVSVEYFPQAEFAMSTGETPVALAPAAIADVPANTDAPIVTAGTVANIGTSEVPQGTLMYFVSQPTGNTVPDAPDYNTDGWTDKVPTANGLKQGDVYVWYYIEGAEPATIAEHSDDNTRSDSDIKPLGATGVVTLAAEPTYDVSLNKTGMAEGEPALWKAKSTNVTEVNLGTNDLEGVKKSETVTVTYTGTKKIIGVKAEKKAALTYPIALSAVTEEYIGSVVATDGNVYATAADAIAASETAVAMIAYVGTESDCDHGLAIALADESGGQKVYSAASTACSGKASVAGRTWRLPSQKDWQYMFIGCGSGESYSEPTGTTIKSYTALTDKLTTASGDAFKTGDSDSYWTSTVRVSGESMWIISFWGSDAYVPFGASFGGGILNGSSHVRACLAF